MTIRVVNGASLRGRLRAAAGGTRFPLDAYPPLFAYSLNRRLTTAFSGSTLFQVSEVSGNTTYDVPMTGSNSDTSGIAAFGGSGVDKRVSIIRNQGTAGTGADATAAIAARHVIYKSSPGLLTLGTNSKVGLQGAGTGGYAIGTYSDSTMGCTQVASTSKFAYVGVFGARNFRDCFLVNGPGNQLFLMTIDNASVTGPGNMMGTFPSGQLNSTTTPPNGGSPGAAYRDGVNGELRYRSNGVPLGTPQRTNFSQGQLPASQSYSLLNEWNSPHSDSPAIPWAEFAYWPTVPPLSFLTAYMDDAATYYGIS